jgi:hypothetical protein
MQGWFFDGSTDPYCSRKKSRRFNSSSCNIRLLEGTCALSDPTQVCNWQEREKFIIVLKPLSVMH